MPRFMRKSAIARNVLAATGMEVAGGLLGSVLSMAAPYVLVPNGEDEDLPEKFCVYQISDLSSECLEFGLNPHEVVQICTQCKNDDKLVCVGSSLDDGGGGLPQLKGRIARVDAPDCTFRMTLVPPIGKCQRECPIDSLVFWLTQ